MLSQLALAILAIIASPQSTKHKTKKSPAKAPVATAAADPAVKQNASILRSADCVLVLKGQMLRQVSMILPPKKASKRPLILGSGPMKDATTASPSKVIRGQTLEHFSYEFPGVLTEESDPAKDSTVVRFRFTPSTRLNTANTQARLHLEDQAKGPEVPPVVVEATEVTGVDPFVFEAAARGQQLVPVSGMVLLKGYLQNPPPSGPAVSMVAPTRPVVSMPLPTMPAAQQGGPARPSLQFQGLSLWAWANSKPPFTVTSNIVYDAKGPQGGITGNVEVSFRISAAH